MVDRSAYVERFREVTDLFKAALGDYCVSRYMQYATTQKFSYIELIKKDIFKYSKKQAWNDALLIDEAVQKIEDIRLWLMLLNQNWELFMKPDDETDAKVGGYCAAYLYKRMDNIGQQISDREAYDLIDAIASLLEVIGPPEFAKIVNEHIDEVWNTRIQPDKIELPVYPFPPKELTPPSRNGASSNEYTLPYLDGDAEGEENTARLPLTGHGYLIEITYPDQHKEQLCIEESPFLIGRNKRNHLVVKDRFTSRYHLMLTCVREQEIYAQDLDSINGTFLDGERLDPYTRAEWKVGQSIKVGETRLTLREND
jgi:hypothetical protein